MHGRKANRNEREDDMALPLIAAGVAGLAAWFMSGCGQGSEPSGGDADNNSTPCSGHGKIKYTDLGMGNTGVNCVCDEGYTLIAEQCGYYSDYKGWIDNYGDTSSYYYGCNDTSFGTKKMLLKEDGTPVFTCECDKEHEALGDTCIITNASADGDADAETDAAASDKFCATQECTSASTYLCTQPSGKEITVQCRDDENCVDGKCALKKEFNDDYCGAGMRSVCQLTDIFDVIEDTTAHSFEHSTSNFAASTSSNYSGNYACSEDDAAVIKAIYSYDDTDPGLESWIAFTLKVLSPPEADHYQLELKADWFYFCSTTSQYCTTAIEASFGDAQHKTIDVKKDNWDSCVYNTIKNFNADGVEDDGVRIRVQNAGRYFSSDSLLAIAAARIWSCKCERE